MKKQILVIGNGFDLSCGLGSRYSDFFKYRFIELFGKQKSHEQIRLWLNSQPGKDAWSNKRLDYFETNHNKWPNGITRWDCIFLFAEEFLDNSETNQWQDIENIIFNVVSFVLWPNESKRFQSNLRFKKTQKGKINRQDQFIQMVNSFAGADSDSLEHKASNLLYDLNDFEKVFANYIVKECNKEQSYKGQACELLKTLANWYSDKENRLDVISFNYSLDARFGQMMKDDQFRLNSWTNIHGVANYNDKNEEVAFTDFWY